MGKSNKKKKEEGKQPNNFIHFSGMATQMGATIAAGVFGGIELDDYLELETPIFTLVGSLLGVAIAMYFVIKDISK
jgi:F0F1-type ATP synthase assembly protein I